MNDKQGSWSSKLDLGALRVKKLMPKAPFSHIKDYILQQQTGQLRITGRTTANNRQDKCEGTVCGWVCICKKT